jgi:phospholipase D1/2
MRLVGASGEPEDGYPADLAEFLSALAEERPSLAIHVLLWDYSVLYSLEREPFPMMNLQWKTASRVRFSLDNCVPAGSSQHQKLVIVDDVLAFSGGLDLTVRRWDTPAHAATNPHRVDPAGKPYRPFHDVQIMVDGNAALALAELARARWQAATSENMLVTNDSVDRWPPNVPPDFTEVEIGIARTEPCGEEVEEDVREVEQLFLASIGAAARTIYIENQFLTSLKIAEALASRMRERPELEVLFVAPLGHDSWLAESAMCNGRIRFIRTLTQAGVGDRMRLTYPVVDAAEPTHTMIHSKVMVVDDRFLRIGSANLNNRSMGTDTECDLAIEASNDTQRAGILAVRNRLLAEHCGVSAGEVAERLASGASLIEVSRTLSRHGHSLRDIIDDPSQIDANATYFENLADPEKPLEAAAFISLFAGDRVRAAVCVQRRKSSGLSSSSWG